MNKKLLLGGIVFLLVVSLVTAATINYVSNSMTAEVTVTTSCNDGIDNDGINGADFGTDPNCASICDTEDTPPGTYDCI